MPRADPIVNANKLELVDDNFATDKRERVAQYIEEHWNDNPDITLTEIGETTGTSRQHVKNVLKDHFEDATGNSSNDRTGKAVPARENVDPELLRRVLNAYRIGLRDKETDDVEPGITDELLELAKRN